MEQSEKPFREVFFDNVPREVVRVAFQRIVASMPETLTDLRKYERAHEAVDLRPHQQRANADRALRMAAEEFRQAGVSSKTVQNRTKSGRHAEVYCGNATITAHFLREKLGTTRPADYRGRLAAANAQLDLFVKELVPADSKIYAHILYGCVAACAADLLERTEPDFALIRFPLDGEGTYSPIVIDLIAEFPGIVSVRTESAPTEEIIDVAAVEFREGIGFGTAG